VQAVWHHDSEPSLVPGLGRFLHLTQGFEVRGAAGEPVCTLVDDITLVADLDPAQRPAPGWHRLLTDDQRLLHLLAARADPAAELPESLDAVAPLWNAKVQRHGDVVSLEEPSGATIALAAPQGGGRERACEVVTPPLANDHETFVEELLATARDLGCTVPTEAAVHLHYDADPFRSPDVLANVVRLFGWWRPALHRALETNPACRRLAPLPTPLVDACADRDPTFEQLRATAEASALTKFVDVNLTQLFAAKPVRNTIEVRILPGSIHTDEIIRRAATVEALLGWCQRSPRLPSPPADVAEATQALLDVAADAGLARR
jgi:hypothetical protein